MTLDEIVRRNALRFPQQAALQMDASLLNWQQLDKRVNQLTNAFREKGLDKGDRVAILAANCPEYFEIYFACARAGLIAVPLNYRLTEKELLEILTHASPKLFLIAAEFVPQARSVTEALDGLNDSWVVGEVEKTGFESYENVLLNAPSIPAYSPADEKDCFAIFYTSGTTGLPKGEMVSHYNLEMNAYNQMVADEATANDSNLISSPIYHMGAVFMAVTYMMLGCAQYILHKFSPSEWLKLMQSCRCSVSLLIPTMINAILNSEDFDEYDLASLRLVFYGGGPMPPAVLEKAISGLKCSFNQGYGLTETLEATFLLPEDHRMDGSEIKQKRLGSAGREAVGAEIRIVDEKGCDLKNNEVGEILIRSRSVISAYWNMPEESARVIKDGWFYTGDLGYLDEDRYLFVVDRIKDLVISGGVNIYTREIESRLFQHPAILEAAIIGLADDEWGEIVTAVVVLHKNQAVSEQELIDFCAADMASYKKPKKVIYLDELPKNPSGKVLKRELRLSLAV
ncbi:MAG: long-chain-fatty-acid--CoA ligase [Gammaproteobacteria bacterium]|nr:long-chain-fatty-acid--CoA ligase [Gammaproteobacteria bacterium]